MSRRSKIRAAVARTLRNRTPADGRVFVNSQVELEAPDPDAGTPGDFPAIVVAWGGDRSLEETAGSEGFDLAQRRELEIVVTALALSEDEADATTESVETVLATDDPGADVQAIFWERTDPATTQLDDSSAQTWVQESFFAVRYDTERVIAG